MTTEGGNWKELTTAATNGDLDTVKYHLDMGMNPNFQHPEFMTTPLIEAARVGNVDIVKLLLEHNPKSKADPTIVADWEGCTPMEEAMKEKHHAIVDLLLKAVPEDYRSECLTIWMTGTYHRDLVSHFLTMGHCVVATAEPGDAQAVCAESVRVKTGNKKLFVLKQSALPEFFSRVNDRDDWHPKRVDVWLHKPRNSNSVVTEMGSQWRPVLDDICPIPFLNNCRKVLFLIDSKSFARQRSNREQVAWLLADWEANNLTCCAVLEPTSWWAMMTYSFWCKAWCQSVLHLLTDMATKDADGVMGKAYTYKRQSIALPRTDMIDGNLQTRWKQELGA